MIGAAMGIGAELVEPMRQAGVVDQLKKAPGFQGAHPGRSNCIAVYPVELVLRWAAPSESPSVHSEAPIMACAW